jgi:hypothetical protein
MAEQALVAGMETVVMCAQFLFRRSCTDREGARGIRARYTLTGECSSFLALFKLTNQDHF